MHRERFYHQPITCHFTISISHSLLLVSSLQRRCIGYPLLVREGYKLFSLSLSLLRHTRRWHLPYCHLPNIAWTWGNPSLDSLVLSMDLSKANGRWIDGLAVEKVIAGRHFHVRNHRTNICSFAGLALTCVSLLLWFERLTSLNLSCVVCCPIHSDL